MSVNAASVEERVIRVEAPPEVPAAPRVPPRDPRTAPFVLEHYPFVWRVLRRFGLSPSDADDSAQHVFIVAVRRLGDIEEGKVRAFLFRTAMHVASRAHRSRRRRHEDSDELSDERIDATPGADELVEQRRARALLDRILEAMPDDLRAVLVLFEIEGLTMSEIAEALDVPPGTVASRLRRARAELADRVARHAQSKHPGGPR